ncbi:unnamed protein product [Dracunculus medinensis]|uniref:Uncharacterized protein n=1 Tax=Dracunculus medinensis TaxID=318479 RepID=A0A0N4U7T2_DRAME|nr:unnamed protein product [Dracunculus medinensis]
MLSVLPISKQTILALEMTRFDIVSRRNRIDMVLNLSSSSLFRFQNYPQAIVDFIQRENPPFEHMLKVLPLFYCKNTPKNMNSI